MTIAFLQRVAMSEEQTGGKLFGVWVVKCVVERINNPSTTS